MNITESLRSNAPLFKDKKSLIDAVTKELNQNRSVVNKKFLAIQDTHNRITFGEELPPQNSKFKGLSESEIRAKHDTKFILSQVVKKLERGLYITDADFIKQCDIKSHVGYRQMLDDPDFKKYKGKAGGIIYWSHPESIEKMKNEGILT